MLDELLLLSGTEIPFPALGISVHQPTLKEISFIGEEEFFIGCDFLRFSKNRLSFEDRNRLEHLTDFDILMSMMHNKEDIGTQKSTKCALLVLVLLFPDSQILLNKDNITFKRIIEEQEQSAKLNNKNYEDFKEILTQIFCLKISDKNTLNPQGEMARKIADKIKKGKDKVAKQKGKTNKMSVFSRYSSILSVGNKQDLNEILNYTVYQLFDIFQRFELKENSDVYIKAKMAGAKNLKEVDNWMKDIHE